jgi:hypothetical protein
LTEVVTNTTATSGEGQEETVESLKAKIAEYESTVESLNGEAAKHKTLRRQAEKERDTLRKNKPASDGSEDYKKLYEESNKKIAKTLERAKSADINTALHAQFGKAKVASDKILAAQKLVDSSLLEWDEDSGVDNTSVIAAVAKLKSEHPFLFEGTVAPTNVVNAGDGGTQKSTITRAQFASLSPVDQVAKMKAKVKIVE